MSDETTFDFALYLGTTTPLTITLPSPYHHRRDGLHGQ